MCPSWYLDLLREAASEVARDVRAGRQAQDQAQGFEAISATCAGKINLKHGRFQGFRWPGSTSDKTEDMRRAIP